MHRVSYTDEPLDLIYLVEDTFAAVEMNPELLEFSPIQTPEICLNAVRKNPKVFKFVRNQTESLCKEAVTLLPSNLRYVKVKTLDIIEETLIRDGTCIQYVPESFWSDTILETALNTTPCALKFIPLELQTRSLCNFAIERDLACAQYVAEWTIPNRILFNSNHSGREPLLALLFNKKKITEEQIVRIIALHPKVMQFLRNQPESICISAIEENYNVFREIYPKFRTARICRCAVAGSVSNLYYVDNQTREICAFALSISPLTLRYIRNQTVELCIDAVSRDGLALKFVTYKIAKICIEAVKQNPLALEYVPYSRQTSGMIRDCVLKNVSSLVYSNPQLTDIDIILDNIIQLSCGFSQISIIGKFVTRIEQHPDILKSILRNDPNYFHYIENPTEDLCRFVIDTNPFYFPEIKQSLQTASLCTFAVSKDESLLNFCDKKFQTPELFKTALLQNPSALARISEKDQTEELCIVAVQHDASVLRYVKCQTVKIICAALKTDRGIAAPFVNMKVLERSLASIEIEEVSDIFRNGNGNGNGEQEVLSDSDIEITLVPNNPSSPSSDSDNFSDSNGSNNFEVDSDLEITEFSDLESFSETPWN